MTERQITHYVGDGCKPDGHRAEEDEISAELGRALDAPGQPTDPTAVRDFVMACALEMAEDAADRVNLSYKYGKWPIPQGESWPEGERLQQAVEWAMARARVEQHIADTGCGGTFGCSIGPEADAAEKWSKLNEA